MRRSQRMYLQDILERIRRIGFCCADGRETFFEDELLQDGVILAFMIIGVAARPGRGQKRNLNAACMPTKRFLLKNWRRAVPGCVIHFETMAS